MVSSKSAMISLKTNFDQIQEVLSILLKQKYATLSSDIMDLLI